MIITVNQLCDFCEEMKSKGNGNKKIYVAVDDEGNYFRPLFYGFTADEETINEYHEYGVLDETENVVLLG